MIYCWMRKSHYWRLSSKAGMIMASRDAIFHCFRLSERESNEAGKRRQKKATGETCGFINNFQKLLSVNNSFEFFTS